MERKLGLISRAENIMMARARGVKSDAAKISEMTAPWDTVDKPEITTFDEWKPFLEKEAEKMDLIRGTGLSTHFWEVVNRLGLHCDQLFGMIQQQNDCTAWAATRCYLSMIAHQILNGAEMSLEPMNQMALYAYASDNALEAGDRIPNGGRTIDAICMASCESGNAPVSAVGEYDGRVVFTQKFADALSGPAIIRQMGWATYDSESNKADDIVSDIFLSCRAGFPVIIGNTVAVHDGTTKDKNGVYVGTVTGTGWGGGHATSFLDYLEVNGTPYVWWANSHGDIYPSNDGTPAWGCYLTKESVKRLIGRSYFDVMFGTWAENPLIIKNYDLNPQR